jgi:hypothetical protein
MMDQWPSEEELKTWPREHLVLLQRALAAVDRRVKAIEARPEIAGKILAQQRELIAARQRTIDLESALTELHRAADRAHTEEVESDAARERALQALWAARDAARKGMA